MEIKHLEYVLEIHRSKSINKAAKKLFISQPRLSLVLKGMEDDLGYPIFTRTSTGILPTELGIEFLHTANKICQEYQKLKYLDKKPDDSGNLSISANFCSLFSHIFFNFKQQHPAMLPKQDVYNEVSYFTQNITALVSKYNRIAVTHFEIKHKANYENYARKHGMKLYPLNCRLPIRVVADAGHPLTSLEAIYYRDLLRYPFVTYYDVDYDVILGTAGFPPETNIQFVSCRATYYDAIRLGGCISLSVDFAPGEAERIGCVCLPVEDAGQVIPAYIVPNDCTLNDREKAFLTFFIRQVGSFASRQNQGTTKS